MKQYHAIYRVRLKSYAQKFIIITILILVAPLIFKNSLA